MLLSSTMYDDVMCVLSVTVFCLMGTAIQRSTTLKMV